MLKTPIIKDAPVRDATKAATKGIVNSRKLDRTSKRHTLVRGKRVRYEMKQSGSWHFIREILKSTDSNIGEGAGTLKGHGKRRFKKSERAVVKIIEAQNPYADKDGAPKKGEETQFFKWAEKNWNKHLLTLSEDEREKHIAAAISLSEKMND